MVNKKKQKQRYLFILNNYLYFRIFFEIYSTTTNQNKEKREEEKEEKINIDIKKQFFLCRKII